MPSSPIPVVRSKLYAYLSNRGLNPVNFNLSSDGKIEVKCDNDFDAFPDKEEIAEGMKAFVNDEIDAAIKDLSSLEGSAFTHLGIDTIVPADDVICAVRDLIKSAVMAVNPRYPGSLSSTVDGNSGHQHDVISSSLYSRPPSHIRDLHAFKSAERARCDSSISIETVLPNYDAVDVVDVPEAVDNVVLAANAAVVVGGEAGGEAAETTTANEVGYCVDAAPGVNEEMKRSVSMSNSVHDGDDDGRKSSFARYGSVSSKATTIAVSKNHHRLSSSFSVGVGDDTFDADAVNGLPQMLGVYAVAAILTKIALEKSGQTTAESSFTGKIARNTSSQSCASHESTDTKKDPYDPTANKSSLYLSLREVARVPPQPATVRKGSIIISLVVGCAVGFALIAGAFYFLHCARRKWKADNAGSRPSDAPVARGGHNLNGGGSQGGADHQHVLEEEEEGDLASQVDVERGADDIQPSADSRSDWSQGSHFLPFDQLVDFIVPEDDGQFHDIRPNESPRMNPNYYPQFLASLHSHAPASSSLDAQAALSRPRLGNSGPSVAAVVPAAASVASELA
jgi:hypothetical protein